MVKSRGGRPTNVTIADDDAKRNNKAFKATVRYYGIRLQDLGSESWIAHAMQTEPSHVGGDSIIAHRVYHGPRPQPRRQKTSSGIESN